MHVSGCHCEPSFCPQGPHSPFDLLTVKRLCLSTHDSSMWSSHRGETNFHQEKIMNNNECVSIIVPLHYIRQLRKYGNCCLDSAVLLLSASFTHTHRPLLHSKVTAQDKPRSINKVQFSLARQQSVEHHAGSVFPSKMY